MARFDSFKTHGNFKFPVNTGQVIAGRLHKVFPGVVANLTVTHSSGWDKAVMDMTVGEISVVTIPACVNPRSPPCSPTPCRFKHSHLASRVSQVSDR